MTMSTKSKKELKMEKDAEVEELIIDGINNVVKSDAYKNYLDLSMNIRNMSSNNKMFLALQSWSRGEEISFVKTARCWSRDYERIVNKGEKAYYVQSPTKKRIDNIFSLMDFMEKHPYAGAVNDVDYLKAKITDVGYADVVVGFRWIAEFDVSQTNGKALPEHEYVSNIEESVKDFEEIKTALCDYMSGENVPVVFKEKNEDHILSHAYGYFSPVRDEIVVSVTDRSEADQLKTLIHEMAHALLHGKELKTEGLTSEKVTNSIKEVEAESVAYMVCKKLGIDSECRSFGYLASYLPEEEGKRRETFGSSFNRIDKCANQIYEKALEKVINKDHQEMTNDEEEMEL